MAGRGETVETVAGTATLPVKTKGTCAKVTPK